MRHIIAPPVYDCLMSMCVCVLDKCRTILLVSLNHFVKLFFVVWPFARTNYISLVFFLTSNFLIPNCSECTVRTLSLPLSLELYTIPNTYNTQVNN